MDLRKYLPLFTKHQSYLLTTHLNPDGDAIGSQLALGEFLKMSGQSVRTINCSPVPRHYKFLDPDGSKIELYSKSKHEQHIKNSDCIIILDTNHSDRLGDMEKVVLNSNAVKIIIDHHLDSQDFADYYITDIEASATGEIMYYILKELTGNKLTDTIAINLYTAIMTDTGSFRFPRTTSTTHRIVADLLQYKIDPSEVYREVYERGPVNRLNLLGLALSTLETYHDGRVAVMWVSKDMFQKTQMDVVETDGFVNYTMQIDGIDIGLLFTENENSIKISFRARGDVYVNELAKEFNGNGHQHAAGAIIENSDLKRLIEDVVSRASKYLSPKKQ